MRLIYLFRRTILAGLLLHGCIAGAQSDPGSYDDATHVYRNRSYAFACKVPAGWVLRSDQLKPNNAGDNQVLMAAFERPPEATSPAPAATILIAAESQATYPTLKTAEDYFAPLAEVITAKGFRAVNDPYEFPIRDIHLVRQDYAHEQAVSEKSGSGKDRPTTYQSTLVLLSHGSILSFTFLAATEDEVDSLIENLSFTPARPPRAAPKSHPKTAPATKTTSPQKSHS